MPKGMEVQGVIDILQASADPAQLAGMARFGIKTER